MMDHNTHARYLTDIDNAVRDARLRDQFPTAGTRTISPVISVLAAVVVAGLAVAGLTA